MYSARLLSKFEKNGMYLLYTIEICPQKEKLRVECVVINGPRVYYFLPDIKGH